MTHNRRVFYMIGTSGLSSPGLCFPASSRPSSLCFLRKQNFSPKVTLLAAPWVVLVKVSFKCVSGEYSNVWLHLNIHGEQDEERTRHQYKVHQVYTPVLSFCSFTSRQGLTPELIMTFPKVGHIKCLVLTLTTESNSQAPFIDFLSHCHSQFRNTFHSPPFLNQVLRCMFPIMY